MIVKLLTEHHLEFLSLKRGCRGSSESSHPKCHIVGTHMSWLFLSAMAPIEMFAYYEIINNRMCS